MLQNTRCGKYVEINIVKSEKGLINKKTKYSIVIKQCPAFLMMALADLAGSDHASKDMLGFEVASAYKASKFHFIWSAIDTKGTEGQGINISSINLGFVRLGGMTHGHWPLTYYLITRFGN